MDRTSSALNWWPTRITGALSPLPCPPSPAPVKTTACPRHLDEGETLIQAAIRETLEESAWQVKINHLIEFSQWTSPNSNTHFLRACFAGTAIKHFPEQKLDDGIIRSLWMSRDEVAQNAHRLRSPLVLNHIDHYIAGKKFDLDFFSYYDK